LLASGKNRAVPLNSISTVTTAICCCCCGFDPEAAVVTVNATAVGQQPAIGNWHVNFAVETEAT